jgi:MoaA/NifB/PqqE/SkfB family radical SAM enzyme
VSANFPEIDFHSFELLRPPFPDSSIRPLTAPEYADALSTLKPYWARFDRYRPVLKNLKVAAREAELETLEQERMVYACYAGTVSGVLNPEGTVALCEVQWEIGNIREFGWSFAKAWFSPKANELRGRVARRECWCTHSCFMSSSLPFSVKGIAKLAATALLPVR